MKRFFQLSLVGAALALTSTAALAQPETASSARSNGTNQAVPASQQLFRKSVWRMLDLREKQNQPLFSEGREISRIIIEAVKRGELQAYRDDSLNATLTAAQVREKMSVAGESDGRSADEIAAGIEDGNSDDWERLSAAAASRTARGGQTRSTAATQPRVVAPSSYEYRYKDLYQMELREDLVFDKKSARMRHVITSITLLVPSTVSTNTSGMEKPIATFRYNDLVRVFRNHPDVAIWYNAQNEAQHKNLADAFELGLYNSYITKISNPGNERLADMAGGEKQGIMTAQQAAADLVEYEYNLWNF